MKPKKNTILKKTAQEVISYNNIQINKLKAQIKEMRLARKKFSSENATSLVKKIDEIISKNKKMIAKYNEEIKKLKK